MRVAHLLRKYDPTEWGGTEATMERLAAGLAAQQVESIVYAPRLPAGKTVADPLAAVGCTVRRFRAFVSLWGIPAERKRRMVAVGGNLFSFALAGSLWREAGLDVIHSHALGRLGAIGRAVARRRRIPFVLSVHGGAYDLPAGVRQEMMEMASGGWDWAKPFGLVLGSRHLLEECDAIITLNPREAAMIRRRHPGRRVLVQPHGVPAALFARDSRLAAREAFPALSGRLVLLVLGRIDPTKNQEWLIGQAAELVRRHPRVLLVFAGACMNQEHGDSLRRRVEREGLDGSVIWTGGLPPGDPRLIGLLQEAQAVVLPSVSETFGLVILEAWAAGAPVISSRTSGATALVEDDVNGLIFDLDRPESFHAAVARLLALPERRAQWGEAGRMKVIAEHDTSVVAGRMKRIYEEVIEEKNAHRHTPRR